LNPELKKRFSFLTPLSNLIDYLSKVSLLIFRILFFRGQSNFGPISFLRLSPVGVNPQEVPSSNTFESVHPDSVHSNTQNHTQNANTLSGQSSLDKNTEEHPTFHSSFKRWIKIVAWIVILTFGPEQISWAVNYNPGVLWKSQAARYVDPSAPKAQQVSAQIAGNVENILRQIAYKENPQISLNLPNNAFSDPELNDRSILIKSNIFFTNNKIEKIYTWLREPGVHPLNCGVYALRDLLGSHDIDVPAEELSVITLLVDILNHIIEPGEPKLKTSLYAIHRVAAAYGLDLKAAKLDPNQILNIPTPFLASLQDEHFVLVVTQDEKNVYYADIGQARFMSKEDFIKQSTGFVLASKLDGAQNVELVSDSMKAFVWGSRWQSRYDEIPGLTDTQFYTQLGVDIVTSVVSGLAKPVQLGQELVKVNLILNAFGRGISSFTQSLNQAAVLHGWWDASTANTIASIVTVAVLVVSASAGGTPEDAAENATKDAAPKSVVGKLANKTIFKDTFLGRLAKNTIIIGGGYGVEYGIVQALESSGLFDGMDPSVKDSIIGVLSSVGSTVVMAAVISCMGDKTKQAWGFDKTVDGKKVGMGFGDIMKMHWKRDIAPKLVGEAVGIAFHYAYEGLSGDPNSRDGQSFKALGKAIGSSATRWFMGNRGFKKKNGNLQVTLKGTHKVWNEAYDAAKAQGLSDEVAKVKAGEAVAAVLQDGSPLRDVAADTWNKTFMKALESGATLDQAMMLANTAEVVVLAKGVEGAYAKLMNTSSFIVVNGQKIYGNVDNKGNFIDSTGKVYAASQQKFFNIEGAGIPLDVLSLASGGSETVPPAKGIFVIGENGQALKVQSQINKVDGFFASIQIGKTTIALDAQSMNAEEFDGQGNLAQDSNFEYVHNSGLGGFLKEMGAVVLGGVLDYGISKLLTHIEKNNKQMTPLEFNAVSFLVTATVTGAIAGIQDACGFGRKGNALVYKKDADGNTVETLTEFEVNGEKYYIGADKEIEKAEDRYTYEVAKLQDHAGTAEIMLTGFWSQVKDFTLNRYAAVGLNPFAEQFYSTDVPREKLGPENYRYYSGATKLQQMWDFKDYLVSRTGLTRKFSEDAAETWKQMKEENAARIDPKSEDELRKDYRKNMFLMMRNSTGELAYLTRTFDSAVADNINATLGYALPEPVTNLFNIEKRGVFRIASYGRQRDDQDKPAEKDDENKDIIKKNIAFLYKKDVATGDLSLQLAGYRFFYRDIRGKSDSTGGATEFNVDLGDLSEGDLRNLTGTLPTVRLDIPYKNEDGFATAILIDQVAIALVAEDADYSSLSDQEKEKRIESKKQDASIQPLNLVKTERDGKPIYELSGGSAKVQALAMTILNKTNNNEVKVLDTGSGDRPTTQFALADANDSLDLVGMGDVKLTPTSDGGLQATLPTSKFAKALFKKNPDDVDWNFLRPAMLSQGIKGEQGIFDEAQLDFYDKSQVNVR